MLDLEPDWDESAIGFSKFSRFLRQAHDAEAINLRKLDGGSYELTLPGPESVAAVEETAGKEPRRKGRERSERKRGKAAVAPAPAPAAAGSSEPALESLPAPAAAATPAPGGPPTGTRTPAAEAMAPPSVAPAASPEAPAATTAISPPAEPAGKPTSGRAPALSIGLRRGSRGRLLAEPPPLLEGQAVGVRPKAAARAAQIEAPLEGAKPVPRPPDLRMLGLPRESADIVAYISSYSGIGPRSARAFAEAVGAENIFITLNDEPDRVRGILGEKRGEKLLAAWREDVTRRTAEPDREPGDPEEAAAPSRGRRGGRRRGPRKTSKSRGE
jgi:hypothetical protein